MWILLFLFLSFHLHFTEEKKKSERNREFFFYLTLILLTLEVWIWWYECVYIYVCYDKLQCATLHIINILTGWVLGNRVLKIVDSLDDRIFYWFIEQNSFWTYNGIIVKKKYSIRLSWPLISDITLQMFRGFNTNSQNFYFFPPTIRSNLLSTYILQNV